jgi:toxin ParE1/3/4
MGVYRLSEESANDISSIYEYGIEKFGLGQAKAYLLDLQDTFQTLAENINIGNDASEFLPSLRRFVYKSHMIFYLQSESGVFVIRILNQSMDYQHYLK